VALRCGSHNAIRGAIPQGKHPSVLIAVTVTRTYRRTFATMRYVIPVAGVL
jgi:hypothetical protein